MDRILEPELMDGEEQARAYSEADFTEPHNMFVEEFRRIFPKREVSCTVLDLGCGPADVTVRFARAFPHCQIDAVEGAQAMLKFARQRVEKEKMTDRIRLIHEVLPSNHQLQDNYGIIISNSLLHHLADPATLWDTVTDKCAAGGTVFIMDLMRPVSKDRAKALVDCYAAEEPHILREDFYHSMLAAHRPEEVEKQLGSAGIEWMKVKAITDRHLIAYGSRPVCT